MGFQLLGVARQRHHGCTVEFVLSRGNAQRHRQRAKVGSADWDRRFFPGAKGVLAGLEAEILQEENLTTRAMLRTHFATIRFDECLSTERRICPRSPRSS